LQLSSFPRATPLDLISRFKNASLGTADYVSCFFQYLLADGGLGMVTIHCDGSDYVMSSNCMGEAHSPFFAMCVASVVMYKAREDWARAHNAGEQPEIPRDCFEQFITVTRNKEPVAFMACIYDNHIVIAIDRVVRDQLIAMMNGCNTTFNIEVKQQVGADAEGWFKSDTKLPHDLVREQLQGDVSTRRGRRNREVEIPRFVEATNLIFSGVEYIMIKKYGLGFRHALENVVAWRREFTETLALLLLNAMTNRHVAELLGVLIWDCRTYLRPLGSIRKELRQMSRVGKLMAQQNDWDGPCPLSKVEQQELLAAYEAFLERAERRDIVSCPPRQETRPNKVVIASDSSLKKAAGMRLDGGGAHEVLCVEEWKCHHNINRKETLIAIDTVRKIIPTIPVDQQESTEIILGEDNCSALAALTSFYYPTDPFVCGELMQLYEELGGISLTVFWLPTLRQCADEPSRSKPVNLEKCRWAYDFLLAEYERHGGNAWM
jgi:hypothetical protein